MFMAAATIYDKKIKNKLFKLVFFINIIFLFTPINIFCFFFFRNRQNIEAFIPKECLKKNPTKRKQQT